jgi:hypothetical protein
MTADPLYDPTDQDRPAAYVDEDGTLVLRASAITQCTRLLAGVAEGWEQKQAPEGIQRRFDDGHLHEMDIINRTALHYKGELGADGVKIAGSLRILPGKVRIEGSADALLEAIVGFGELEDGTCLIEAKSMAKAAWAEWKLKRFAAFEAYAWQASIYQIAIGRVYGLGHPMPLVMACKNKDSGEIDYHAVPEPPVSLARIRSRAMEVYKAWQKVRTGEVALEEMLCDRTTYPCPLYYIHETKQEKKAKQVTKQGPKEDVTLELLMRRYLSAQQDEARLTNLKRSLANEIRAHCERSGKTSWVAADGTSLSCKPGNRTIVTWSKLRDDWPGLDPDAYKIVVPTSDAVVRVTAPKEGT